MPNEISLAVPTISDLPPRTWRGWWLAWPKWFRIGGWAALAMAVLNLAVISRIMIGLKEGPEIAELRCRANYFDFAFTYAWEDQSELFEGQHLVVAGLMGRSGASVRGINLGGNGTDADLHWLAKKFPKLKRLHVDAIEVTAAGLRSLRLCRQIEILGLADTPIDDAAVEELTALEQLEDLDLSGTLVTDAAIPALKRLRSLNRLSLAHTDVTEDAIATWRAERSKPVPEIELEAEDDRERVLCAIRWAEGNKSVTFPDVLDVYVSTPLTSTAEDDFRFGYGSLFGRRYLLGPWRGDDGWSTSDLMALGDGDYSLRLRIGDFESDPIAVAVRDGLPTVRSIEFRMPCTKAEALASAKGE